MMTDEFFEIIAFLLASLSGVMSLGSLISVYNGERPLRIIAKREKKPLDHRLRVRLLAASGICVLISVTILIAEFLRAGNAPDWLPLFWIVVVSLFAGTSVIQILVSSSDLRQLKEEQRKILDVPEQLDLEGPLELRRYRENVRKDVDVQTIQVAGMSFPVNFQEMYVPLKVRICRSEPADDRPIAGLKEHIPWVDFPLEPEHSAGQEPENEDKDFLSLLRRNRHCILLGDPGSGKTTLLKSVITFILDTPVQATFSQERDEYLPDLPVFISLHKFAALLLSSAYLGPALADFIYQCVDEETPNFTEKFLIEGRILLLLDGLDETFLGDEPERLYDRVVDAIGELAGKYPRLKIVVTSRKSAYFQRSRFLKYTGREEKLSFWELEVLPFRADDIRTFVERWPRFQPQLSFAPAQFNNELDQNPGIRDLARNPLFLVFMILAYQLHGKNLSRYRADIYQNCVRVFSVWDASRGIDRASSLAETDYDIEKAPEGVENDPPGMKRSVDAILEYVAYFFYKERQGRFEQKALLDCIKQVNAANASVFLDLVATRSGLLKKDETGRYQFLHGRFQEYYTARYLAEHIDQGQALDLGPYLHDVRWKEILQLCSAYIQSDERAERFLEDLLVQYELGHDFFLTPVVIAGHCLAARSPRSVDLRETQVGQDIVDALMGELKSTPYSLTRDQVAESLVDIAGYASEKRQMADLLKNLLAASWETLDGRPGRNLLISRSVARGAAHIGKTALAGTLLKLLCERGGDESIARSLGLLDNVGQVAEMCALLTSPTPESLGAPDHLLRVRLSLITALGSTREQQVALLLLNLLKGSLLDDLSVQFSLVDALEKLNLSILASELCDLLAVDRLDIRVQERIAEILGNMHYPQIARDLLTYLEEARGRSGKESAKRLRLLCNIALTLGSLDVSESDLALLRARLGSYYRDETLLPALRSAIATSLYRLGETSLIDELKRLLATSLSLPGRKPRGNFTEAYIGEAVATALGQRREAFDATSALLETVENKQIDQQVRIAAIRALGQWDGKVYKDRDRVVAHLLRLLKDRSQDGAMREVIAGTLAGLNDPALISNLFALLDENEKVSLRLVEIIGQLSFRDKPASRQQSAGELVRLLNEEGAGPRLDFVDSVHRALWEVSKDLPGVQVVHDSRTQQVSLLSVPG